MDPKALRGRILYALYRHFQIFPYAPMDPAQLGDLCGADPGHMNWNLVYLEKCGLVTLGKSIDAVPPHIACTVDISALGIDTVEDPTEMVRRFGSAFLETDRPS